MSDARRLLVVFHSRSGGTRALAEAVIAGANDPAVNGVEMRVRRATEADADDVRWCDAIVVGTPENFGYMSGLIKDFFERIYYDLLDDSLGLPYALFVKGGHDGEGAARSIERITTGLAWREVLPAVVVTGDAGAEELRACTELGQTMAAGLEAGMF